MDAETARIFLRDCEEIFAFAVRDHGFKPGRLTHEEGRRRWTVMFLGDEIGLECEYEYFDRFATLYIVRLEDGEQLNNFSNEYGQRVRALLFEILRHRGDITFVPKKAPRSERRRWDRMDDRTRWKIGLESNAADLKRFGQDILRDDPSCFDGLGPKG